MTTFQFTFNAWTALVNVLLIASVLGGVALMRVIRKQLAQARRPQQIECCRTRRKRRLRRLAALTRDNVIHFPARQERE